LPTSPISFSRITKTYRLYPTPKDRFLETFTRRSRHVDVHALRDVSGEVPIGTVAGLIGENGSGKSTLLKILAGTTTPTSGTLSVPGRIASILELGSAFHPEVTGRRNVVLQAALMGLGKDEIAGAMAEIEAFAELGDFFDRPVRTYSSGMSMRLAFAVATAVLPDVVILDEALAVGDGHFQKKCIDRLFELKASGRTIFFCSHAMYYVTTICDQAIWLRNGEVAAAGDSHKVVLAYERYMTKKEKVVRPGAAEPQAIAPGSHGRILDVRLVGGNGENGDTFRPGEPWAVDLEFIGDAPARPLQIYFAVSTRDNVVCFTADSRTDGAGPFVGKERYAARVALDALPLAKGEFVVHVYLADDKALALFDARSDVSFHVDSDRWMSGLVAVSARWE